MADTSACVKAAMCVPSSRKCVPSSAILMKSTPLLHWRRTSSICASRVVHRRPVT
jgi:hypothetical protein